MSPNNTQTPSGASIRAARRARVRMIRRRVIGSSVALFLAVWSVIAVRLVTGHDPALAKRTTAAVSTATTPTNTTTTATTTPSTASSTGSVSSTGGSSSTPSGGSSSTASGSASSSASPVSSGQS